MSQNRTLSGHSCALCCRVSLINSVPRSTRNLELFCGKVHSKPILLFWTSFYDIPSLGKVAKCSRTVQVFFKKRKKTLQVILKGVQGEFWHRWTVFITRIIWTVFVIFWYLWTFAVFRIRVNRWTVLVYFCHFWTVAVFRIRKNTCEHLNSLRQFRALEVSSTARSEQLKWFLCS